MNSKVTVSFLGVFFCMCACVGGMCVLLKSGIDWTFQVWRHRVHVIQILFRIQSQPPKFVIQISLSFLC